MYKSFLVFLCIIGGYGILPYPRSHPQQRQRSKKSGEEGREKGGEEGGVGMAGCHTLLNKKRQNSNKFWRLTVCRKRA